MRVITTVLALLATISLGATEEPSTSTPLSHEALFAPNKNYPYFEKIADPAVASSQSFEIETAAFLAQCSYIAYIREPDFIASNLAKAGFRNVQFFNTNGTFAYLAQNEDQIILVFRGTETGDQKDYLTDAKIVQREFENYGTAHSGFILALANVETAISEAIETVQKEKQRPILIAGHSLGGALSTLYGIKYPKAVSAIYTFGAPRIGGIRFANAAMENGIPLYRVVHDNDMITRLPTPPFYRHINITYFLSSARELVIDPTSSKKWKSRFSGHGAYMKQLYNQHWAKGDFKAIPSDYFADHSPRMYADILIELSTQNRSD